jgi:hypothetical protein
VFDDLDATLQRLVADPNAPQPLQEADVSFETPGRDFIPARPTVNLFLHRVEENRTLRDAVPIVDSVVGSVGTTLVRQMPPLRVECAYLVTAWSDPGVGAAVRVSQEHRLLGLSLAWLSRFPTIPENYLQGSLAASPFPPPTAVARPQAPEEPGQFWTALGISPRPALTLVVTVSLDLAVATSLGPPVAASELRLVTVEPMPPRTPATQPQGP